MPLYYVVKQIFLSQILSMFIDEATDDCNFMEGPPSRVRSVSVA